MNDTFPTSGRHPERSEGSLYFAFVVACSFVVIPQRRPHRSEGSLYLHLSLPVLSLSFRSAAEESAVVSILCSFF